MDIEQIFQLEWKRKRFAMLAMLHKLCYNPDVTNFPLIDEVECETKVTKQDILNDITCEWDWNKICLEPFVTIDFALEFIDKIKEIIEEEDEQYDDEQYDRLYDFVSHLSASPNITMDDIENNNKISWDWDNVAQNPNFTFEFFLKNIAKFWHITGDMMTIVSMHPCITIDIIHTHSDISWDFAGFALNPNITKEFILQHPDKMHLFVKYSANPKLTMEHVLTIPIKWDWNEVSKNAGITMYDIKNNPDKPWVFACVLRNPNLTFDFIESNIEKIEMHAHIADMSHSLHDWGRKDIFISTAYMYSVFETAEFDVERNAFLETRWNELLLVSMHEYYNQPNVCNTIFFTDMERILFDTYMAKQLTKY
jgi:hypothetical protein